MRKSEYTGWKEVFRFSFVQGIKDKSSIVMMAIFGLIILFAMPISTWMGVKDIDKVEECNIEKVMVYNETPLSIEASQVLTGDRYEGVTVEMAPEQDYEAYTKELEKAEECKIVLAKLEYREDAARFVLTFVKGAHSDFKKKDFDLLVSDFQQDFIIARRRAMDVTDEQAAFMNRGITHEVLFATVDENGEMIIDDANERDGVSLTEYYILLGGIMVVMMMISFSGSTIASSVVTEKSTRVVEYLMINVRPMALIVGKIAAALLQVIIQIAVMGVCYYVGSLLSFLITLLYGQVNVPVAQEAATENALGSFLSAFSASSVVNILIAVIVIILGVLFFAIVAGLAGASVSKMEELGEGLKFYQAMMVGGSYLGIGLCIVQMLRHVNIWIVRAFCVIPIAAPFVVPANLILGKIDVVTALVSMVVLAVTTAFLFKFTASVYESMIFYNGKVLKLKDIIGIAKQRRKGAK